VFPQNKNRTPELGPLFSSPNSGVQFNDGQYVYDVIHPITGKACKMPATGWRYPEEEMKKRIASGRVHFGDDEKTVPNNKTYLKNTELQSLTSMLYQDGRAASKRLETLFGSKVFSNPKDDRVLQRLMSAFGIQGEDIVLDFFSGSGTTAEAVERLNIGGSCAKWIMVQLPENLEDNFRTAKGSNKKITKNAIAYLRGRQLDPVLTNLAEERAFAPYWQRHQS